VRLNRLRRVEYLRGNKSLVLGFKSRFLLNANRLGLQSGQRDTLKFSRSAPKENKAAPEAHHIFVIYGGKLSGKKKRPLNDLHSMAVRIFISKRRLFPFPDLQAQSQFQAQDFRQRDRKTTPPIFHKVASDRGG
jgi:hypothetical protein